MRKKNDLNALITRKVPEFKFYFSKMGTHCKLTRHNETL